MKKFYATLVAILALLNFSYGQWTTGTTNINNTNTGNIGIGITAPLSKLSIVGQPTTTLGGHADLGIGYGSTANQYNGISFFDSTGVRIHRTAFIGFQLKNRAGAGAGDLLFATRSSTTDIAPTERMRINSLGNIGIGTATPASMLDLQKVGTGTAAPQISLTGFTTTTTASAAAYLTLKRSRSTVFGTIATTNMNDYIGQIDFMGVNANAVPAFAYTARISSSQDSVADSTYLSGKLSFFTSNKTSGIKERMTIAGNGNVGIGITNPSVGQLVVHAESVTSSSPGAHVTLGQFNSASFGNFSEIGAIDFYNRDAGGQGVAAQMRSIRGNYAGQGGNLIFSVRPERDAPNMLTEAMRISTKGNVGIGNTNPSYKLDIKTTLGQTNFINIVSNSIPVTSGFIRVTNLTTDSTILAPSLWTKGNVSTFPGASFLGDVLSGQDSGTVPLMRFEARANNTTVTTRPLFEWRNAATTYMTMLANGKVGMGTSNPDEKLTVNGIIHAKAVKVDLSIPAPDYVFNKDYALLGLKQLQEYIAKNHHLPEVPSAAEISKNGLMLGEMNMILLKKVEELTLHLIEKDNQLTDQQKQIKQQEARLAALEKALLK